MPFRKFSDECRKIAGPHAKLLEKPPKGVADLALPCFSLGEPAKTAERLAEEWRKRISKVSLIKEIKAAGPYVNFYIDSEKFSGIVLAEISRKKGKYGAGARKKERIILEHTSINPSGPIHVGRLRNSIIGDSLLRILAHSGYSVETHYFVNDVGKQVAIIAWGEKSGIELKKELVEQYKKYKNKPDFKTMFIYVSANSALENEPAKMMEVEQILQKSESGGRKELAMLKKTAKYCLEGQVESLKRMGIAFDKFVNESIFIEKGSTKKALELLKRKKIIKRHEGAYVIDLSKHGLRETVVLQRSDGTSVYLLRDLAYHLKKLKKADCLINVLGEDHKIEFSELRTILQSILKINKPMEAVHYSFVNFHGEQLSTRLGQTAPLDMLMDEGVEKALAEMGKRKKSTPSAAAAKAIAMAAIKYHIIRTDTMKAINFIWEDALNFEGDTGPYLQYTLARARSILRKSRKTPKAGILNGEKEASIIKILSEFPLVVEKCAKELKPHHLAGYMHELAAEFNEYYHAVRVIGSGNEGQRLVLVNAVAAVLSNGMHLLGIEPLERM